MRDNSGAGISRRIFLTVAGVTLAGLGALARVCSAAKVGEQTADTVGPSAPTTLEAWLRGHRWTQITREILLFSQEQATELGANQLTSEHLLLGIVSYTRRVNVATAILKRLGMSPEGIRQEVLQGLRRRPLADRQVQLSLRARHVLGRAVEEARRNRNNYVGEEHLLLALLDGPSGQAARVLRKHGVTAERVRDQMVATLQR